ncbi:MAG TPA: hypothetical protein VNL15_04430, partial [Dehalococcoidia bacterium]|nr:hypothetical protein [Dehalococcoidia bacterium]
AGMHRIREEFEKVKPDVIIEVANEHFVNFYLDNMPSICIGTGAQHFGPVEPEFWLKIPQGMVPGHPEFAWDLVRGAINSGFEVSFSEELGLDHGTMMPLHFINPERNIPVIPIILNNVMEPMPLPRRIYQLGNIIRQVVASRPKGEKVAIVGTGGLSHWVGTPEMGLINVEFDEKVLDNIEKGKGENLAEWTPQDYGKGGNGAHEVRNWVAVMGALPGLKGEVMTYEPVVPWVTGSAGVVWRV